MDEETKEIARIIHRLLDDGKYKEAISLPFNVKYEEVFRNGSWDLIPAVVDKIQDNTIIITPALHNACEKLLAAIVQKANAEEVLLELVELVETAKNDAQFMIILEPMHIILNRLNKKRNRSLVWCFNAISTYIENIPTPEYNLEGHERVLLDCEDNVRRIEKIYTHLPEFYNHFIGEIIQSECDSTVSKKVVAGFLLELLGKPIINLDVEPQNAARSAARKCCQTIITDICKLEKDIYKLLPYVGYKFKEKTKKSALNDMDGDVIDPYLYSDRLSITSLSGLLYVALSGDFDLPDYALPQVYSAQYIVHNSLLAVLHMLTFNAYGPLTKGLSLCKALFARLSTPVSHDLLVTPIYFDVIKSLVNIATFSNYETTRKEAVKLIRSEINMFDYKGRCILVKSLLDMANHSGIIGYAITLYKNSIEEVFKNQKGFPQCFTGVQLVEMLKKILFLPNGAESDLVELADQLITALNFIIYLSLRDTSNITGIRESFQYIENEYLDKLRIGLNMSKAHYKVKLKDIEEGTKISEPKLDISINVGGNILDDIPLENQKEVIKSALNVFHLMEGLLSRAYECISINKCKV